MRDVRSRKWSNRVLALGVGLLSVFADGGCSGETYEDVLRGLKDAAISGKTYNAIKHADDLDAKEKAVINAFCNVTSRIVSDNETPVAQTYTTSIQTTAEAELGQDGAKLVASPLRKLSTAYNLAGINSGAASAYVRACFK